jgi:exosortase D (VPLPA-CTERM-specific)
MATHVAPRARSLSQIQPAGEEWLAVLLLTVAVVVIFRDGIGSMFDYWARAEYSHGYLIPPIAAYLAFRASDRLTDLRPWGRWAGPLFVLFGLGAFLLGELSTIYTFIHYAFLVCLFGLILAAVGWSGTLALWTALAYLVFMIPLPGFFYYMISTQLQLVSSHLGVEIIRAMGVPVFLEGNIIDLGAYKLQVAEACSGLRYLFPLMSFGFLAACLYKGPVWHRVVLFLSTIPITILMNSLRIGAIGLMVDQWGIGAAEGFLHLFEGWVIFLACVALLIALAAGLQRISGTRKSLGELFGIETPRFALPQFGRRFDWRRQGPLVTCVVLLAVTAPASILLAARSETVPDHKPLVLFPSRLGEWYGQDIPIEPQVLNVLKLADYRHLDFASDRADQWVNLWIAYYDSQRAGASAHSPQACIPSNGWEINTIRQTELNIPGPWGDRLPINRVVITKSGTRAIVYYWFQQRGRVVTNEWIVKWYILVDAVTKQRTDGALIRLVSQLNPGESEAVADARLAAFATRVVPALEGYIPN